MEKSNMLHLQLLLSNTNTDSDIYVMFVLVQTSITVRPLLSAVLGCTKFWSQKPRITEVRG